jgi:glycosyltransferase involved in cell wall biosynthesis
LLKNEGPYLKEWIEYHKLVGFTKFYFYDNESTDNTREILAPYIASGLVEYTLIPGVGKQLDAYNEAIRLHKQSCRWMAFIDLDEYIAPAEPFKSIAEILNEQTAKHGGCAAGMLINWCLYGSSHLEKTPKGLITENFTHHAEQSFWGNHLGKTICNPRLVNYYVSPHYPYYWIGAYSISGSGAVKTNDWKVKPADWSVVRLNHYHTKSYEQYLQKISRGMGDRPNEYVAAGFSHYDKNDVEDPSMLVYQRRLHEALGNS